jgi:acetyl-CoA C-acetyltransferase
VICMGLAREVSIVGCGMTRFHHNLHLDKNSREIFAEAADECFNSVDKGISTKEIDALVIGGTVGEFFEKQSHYASLMSDWTGLLPVPSFRIETACASSSTAVEIAALGIASGMYDTVMVGGVEKMSTLETEMMTEALMSGVDVAYDYPAGVTNPALYAMMANAHFHKYGSTWEQLTAITVKNHHNATMNPKAQYQSEVVALGNKIGAKQGLSFKDPLSFLRSAVNPIVAHPLRLFDCSPTSDGGSAIVMTASKNAKKYTDTPVHLVGLGHASGTMSLHDRPDLTSIPATIEAARTAYKMAKTEARKVDLGMVHDCFTVAEMLATEDLGFFKKGEGGRAAEQGRTAINGEIPINTDGGLKAKGHPIGATGVAMVHEVYKQLRAEAGERQVKDAETGLIHNVGATGGTAIVQIFTT